MKPSIKIEGLREVDTALGQLKKSTGKSVLRRVGLQMLRPVADIARPLAPVDEGDLRDSIGAGTKLTRRQRSVHRKMFPKKMSAEVFVGAGGVPQAHLREFGGDGQPPHPFMRPAWDAESPKIPGKLADALWVEIRKSLARVAKRAAR